MNSYLRNIKKFPVLNKKSFFSLNIFTNNLIKPNKLILFEKRQFVKNNTKQKSDDMFYGNLTS